MSIRVDGGSDRSDHIDDTPAFPTSLSHCIQPEEWVGTCVERTGSETIDEWIEFLGEFGDLALAHAFHAECAHQSIDPAC